MTITEFLLARIAEDEQAANDAGPEYAWYSSLRDVERKMLNGVELDHPDFDEDFDVFTAATKAHARLIARFDPGRVLAECEAKRRIVAEHEITTDVYPVSTRASYGYGCTLCFGTGSGDPAEDFGPCATLEALALPYADHPDYRGEWRP